MQQKMLVILAIGILIGADTPQKDQEKLQGNWTVVSAEKEGEKLAKATLESLKVVIKDDSITIKDGKRDDKATFKLDPSKKPKTIDLTAAEGGKETVLGIYELDGDNLKLCWVKGDEKSPRPTEFATKPKSEQILFVLKREKRD